MVRELLAVVVRAALQWALASLLLANGAAFCLIAAAASALRLGPPCLLCARVHRLLGCYSSAASAADGPSGHEHQALRRLLCDAHVAAVAGSGPEQRLEKTCSASDHVDGRTRDDSDKPGGLEAHRAVSIGSEICEQDRGSDQDDVERSSSIGNDGPYVSLFELAPISPRLPADQHNPPDSAKELDDESTPEPKREIGMPSSVALQAGNGREEEDQEERDLITVSGLFAELRAQRKELEAARAELEAERRAKAEAVEQRELDREAARRAMQLVHEAAAEKQRRLDACRVKAQLYDAMDEAALGAGDGGGLPEQEADGNGNNYQSLVDFFPGSAAVYSSSPDLASLLKLYTESNGGGRRRSMEGVTDDDASAAVLAVAEEEEVVALVAVAAVSGSNGGNVQDHRC